MGKEDNSVNQEAVLRAKTVRTEYARVVFVFQGDVDDWDPAGRKTLSKNLTKRSETV